MDNIIGFLTASGNLPFIISGCLLAAIFIIEIVGLLIGLSMFHSDVDFTADLDGNGIPDYLEVDAGVLGWFNPGNVPIMAFVVIFSTMFTILGYASQWAFTGLTGHFAPMLLSVPIVGVMALATSRWGSLMLARVAPKDVTLAVTLDSLVGEVGIVNMGPVTKVDTGIARFTDKHGTSHNIFINVDSDENIAVGESVVLLGPHREKSYVYMARKI